MTTTGQNTTAPPAGGCAHEAGASGDRPAGIGLLVLLLLILLGVRLAALYINRTDLFFDEAQYWAWSRDLAFGYFSKPPLIAWIIRGFTEVCGHGEACIRAASPLLHTVTAGLIYLAGRKLYDQRVGFWSALVFATLPGVSFSAGLISTDVPLLTLYAAALLAFAVFLERRDTASAIALGICIGLGFLAKYAMIYFVAGILLYLLATPARRGMLLAPRLVGSLAIAALLLVPNIWWNVSNGGVTLSHTAANANWQGELFNFGKALEFLGAQLGVFGPILFGALLVIVVRAMRGRVTETDRMLVFLAVPVILIVTTQAFISRAHGNWAAVAYVPATILVTATMLRDGADGWRRGSLALHVVLMAVIIVGNASAGRVALPFDAHPYRRVLGWSEMGAAVGAELDRAAQAGRPYGAILADRRAYAAELLYQLRERSPVIRAWRRGPGVHNHFELTIPFTAATPQPVLLVNPKPDVAHITRHFAEVQDMGLIEVPAGAGDPRTAHMWRLSGYRRDNAER